MALERRDNAGAAVITELAAGINATDLSITIASATGWPSGGANGPFFIVIDEGLAGEEKVEVQSRTGTTLTVASTGKRGVDDTSAGSHATGATVKHCFTAQDSDEANYTMAQTVGKVTTKGDLLAGTGANALARVAAGSNDTVLVADSAQAAGVKWAVLGAASLGTDSVGSDEIAANAVGASELADNAVDTNAIANLAVTAAKIANDTITATQIAADAVGTSEIAANAVGASELADNAVDAAAIAANAVTTVKILDDNVTAAKIADGAIDNAAKIVDAVITLAKLGIATPTDYSGTVTFTNPSGAFVLGTGGTKTAFYIKFFGWNVMLAHFTLGTGGNISAGGAIEVSLPQTNNANFRGFCAGRVRDSSTGVPWSGTGVIAASGANAVNWATAGSANLWDATNPFNWEDGDSFDGVLLWYSGT